MNSITFGIHVLVIVFTFFLCGCNTLGPKPSGPQGHFVISVDSMPQGADVYAISGSGQTIGAKIGKTPCELKISVAYQVWKEVDGFDNRFPGAVANWWAWSPGNCVELRNDDYRYWLKIALLKDGYRTKKLVDPIAKVPRLYRGAQDIPANCEITVPLERFERPRPEGPAVQHQQQQQTVVISGDKIQTGQVGDGQMGTIAVSCNISDAEIYIDSTFVGNTPANLNLKDGVYTLEVKKTGYNTFRREIRALAGSDLSSHVELNKE